MVRNSQPFNPLTPVDPTVISSLTGTNNNTGIYLDADGTNSSLLCRTANTNSIYVDKFQNVGINTTYPAAQLDINSADGVALQLTYNGTSNVSILSVSSTGILDLNASGRDVTINAANDFNIKSHNGSTTGLRLNGNLITASATELNYVDTTAGTAEASKALVVDASRNISNIGTLSATSLTGTLTTANQSAITTVGTLTNIATSGTLTMGSTVISASEIAVLDGVVAGTASASKALVLSSGSSISGINSVSCASLNINITSKPYTTVNNFLSLICSTTAVTNTAAAANSTDSTHMMHMLISGPVVSATNTNVTTTTASTLYINAPPTSGTNMTITNSYSLYVGTGNCYFGGTLSLQGTIFTSTQAGYLTSITPGTASANKALVLDSSLNLTGIHTLTVDTLVTTNLTGNFANLTLSGTLTMGSTIISASEIAVLDDVVAGTASASKALILDSSSGISGISSIGTTTLVLGGTTLTSTQAAYLTPLTPGIASANKALVVDSNNSITGITSLSCGYFLSAILLKNYSSLATFRSALFNTTTCNNTVTASGGTDTTTHQVHVQINAPILTATNTNVTTSIASSLYIGGAPSAGTNMTITNAYALYVFSGTCYFGGTLSLQGITFSSTQAAYLSSLTPGTASASKALVLNSSSNISGINSVGTTTLVLGGNTLTSTQAAYLTSITAGTASAGKALVLNSSSSISGIDSLSATSLTGTLTTANQSAITTVGTLTNIATIGTLTMGTTVISESEIAVLDGVVAGTAAAGKALVLDSNLDLTGVHTLVVDTLTASNITGTLSNLTLTGTLTIGTTSINQTEIATLDGVVAGVASTNKALVLDSNSNISGINSLSATSLTGTLTTANQSAITTVGTLTNIVTSGTLTMGSTVISETEIAALDNVVAGTAGASKALVLDANSDISGIHSLSATNLTATSLTGTLTTANQSAITTVGTLTNIVTSGTLTMGSTVISASEIAVIDNIIAGTASASKALVLDINSDVSGVHSLSATNLIATSLTGTLTTANQSAITTVGTLTNIATSGTLTMGSTIINEAEIMVIDNVVAGTASASKALVLDTNLDITGIHSLSATNLTATSLTGTLATANQSAITTVGTLTNIATSGTLTMGSTVINEAEIAVLDNIVAGIASASKALVLDANSDVSGIDSLSATNLIATSLTGTLATANQSAITTVGTLTNIATSGTLTMGATVINESEIAVLDGVVAGTASASKALILNGSSSISGINSLSATSLTGTLTTANQSAITTVGTLTNIVTSGTLTMGSTVINEAELAVLDGITAGIASASKALILNGSSSISGINSLSATSLTGTLTTANQSAITTVGTLTNIATSGTLTMGTTVITESEIAVLHQVVAGTASASKALVLNGSSSISGINSLSATSITGTLTTANQSAITTVGTLTNIATSGTLTMGSTVITASEIAVIDGVVAGTASAGKALVLDSSSNISGINTLDVGIANININNRNYTNSTDYRAFLCSTSTLNNNYTAANGTDVNNLIYFHIAPPLMTATNTNVTSAIATTVYIQGAPAAGTNMTITNSYALYVLSGVSYFGSGGLNLQGTPFTATQAGYLTPITPGTASASKALVLNASSSISGITSLGTTSLVLGGTTLGATEAGYLTSITTGTASASKALVLNSSSNISGINSLGTTTLVLGGTTMTSTQAGYLTSLTIGTASASKALILDASSNIAGINSLGTTTLVLGGTTMTSTHLGYLTGITPGVASANKALVVNGTLDIAGLNSVSATSLIGTITTASQTAITTVGTLTNIATSGALTIGTTVINEADIMVIHGIVAGTASAGKALVLNSSFNISGINALSAASITGTLTTANQSAITTVGTLTNIATSGTLTIGSTVITATEIAVIDGVVAGTAAVNKALVLDVNADIVGIHSVSTTNLIATSLTGTLTTANQSAITTVGTLTNIATSGTLTMGSTVITEAEIAVIDGVTAGTALANKALILNSSSNISGINSLSATSITGTLTTANQSAITTVGTLTNIATSGTLTMGSTIISATELAVIDGVVAGTAAASKALVLNSSSNISGINSLSSTKLSIGTPSNSNLPIEVGYTTYQFTGAYAYSDNMNAHSIVDAGFGPSANYSLRADGRILCTGEIEITSDRRLKKNIQPLLKDMCRRFVFETKPVSFNWKSGDTTTDYGYVAQDILKAGFKDLVKVVPHPGILEDIEADGFLNPSNNKFVFSPGKVIPILAVNQKQIFTKQDNQQEEIEALKQRISQLEMIIQSLLPISKK